MPEPFASSPHYFLTSNEKGVFAIRLGDETIAKETEDSGYGQFVQWWKTEFGHDLLDFSHESIYGLVPNTFLFLHPDSLIKYCRNAGRMLIATRHGFRETMKVWVGGPEFHMLEIVQHFDPLTGEPTPIIGNTPKDTPGIGESQRELQELIDRLKEKSHASSRISSCTIYWTFVLCIVYRL